LVITRKQPMNKMLCLLGYRDVQLSKLIEKWSRI